MTSDIIKIRIASATKGHVAVIMREGPSKQTRMLKWNTINDEIEEGQWICSKIPHFSINSDASLILSFVQSYRRNRNFGTWVALSRPPWFTALAIWHINDSWGGECCFLTDEKIFIKEGMSPVVFEGSLAQHMEWTTKECTNRKSKSMISSSWQTNVSNGELVSTKQSQDNHFEIRYSLNSSPCAYYHRQSQLEPIDLPEDTFDLDLDAFERIVFSRRNGEIHRITEVSNGIEQKKIFDLSNMKFESIVAPVPGEIVNMR